MVATLLGIVTEVREEQERNALWSIVVTLLGMVIEVKEEQYANAEFPMVVTLLGILNAPAFPPGHWIKVVMALL